MPDSSQYAGQLCGGVNIVVVDRATLRPVNTGLEIARQLHQLFPPDWQTKRLNALLSDRQTLDAGPSALTAKRFHSSAQGRAAHPGLPSHPNP